MNTQMKFMVDANVDDGVGDILLSRAYPVDYVNKSFLPGTPDSQIDNVARLEGWIIVSHDQAFLEKIQQPRFGFTERAHTGYGRIMLLTRESLQIVRVVRCIDLIETLFEKAIDTDRRFLLSIGPNYIRYDDEPLSRTPKGTNAGTQHIRRAKQSGKLSN
jgi:uncharacterized protein with PIN domain